LKLIKLIPNILTISNGICGVLSIVFITDYLDHSFPKEVSYFIAFLLIFIACIFDFLDGFVARLTNSSSKIGLQLDSFSDLISFSIAPSFLMFDVMQNSDRFMSSILQEDSLIPYFSFLLIPFAMYRLARFNDGSSMINFQGLPTPAVGLFFMSLPFLQIELTHTFIIVLIIIFSLLMVSSIKFYSFKINVRDNERFLLILLILYGIVLLGLILTRLDLLSFFSISIIIYVALNLVLKIFEK
tara:strand:- start:5193 stop:5918 length:726 start_codon:yes stop_codon:yes gene_type:complete